MPLDRGLADPIVDALWLDPANPSVLVAGTWYDGGLSTGGLYRSTNGGLNWSLVFPYVTSGFLQLGSTLWAATDGGIAKSTNGGASWSFTLPTSNPVRVLEGVSGLLYAGLDNGTVLVNVSGTAGWRATDPTNGTSVWSIAVDPTDPEHVIVVEWRGYLNPDTYVSEDAGKSWSVLSSYVYGAGAQYVAFNESTTAPSTPILFVGADGALFESKDNGSTFQQLSLTVDVRLIVPLPNGSLLIGSDQGLFLGMGAAWVGLTGPVDASLLTGFAVSGTTILTTVQDFSPIISFDDGTGWNQLRQPSPPVGEDGVAAINPLNSSWAYVFTTAGFQYSSDGGYTFHPSSASLGYNSQGTEQLIAFDPNASTHLYVAAKNGVFTSMNGGRDFAPLSWSFSSPTVIAVAPADNQTMYVGDSDTLYVTHDGGANWSPCGLASTQPVLSVAIEPHNTSDLLVATGSGPESVYSSTDGCQTFGAAGNGLPSYPTNTSPWALWNLAFNSSGSAVALATDDGVYESTNLGQNWVDISGNITPLWVSDVAWSGPYLYASTYGEGIVRARFAAVPTAYPVAYTETGLPSGTSWSITLNGQTHTTTSLTITFPEPNGTYAYSAGPVWGYTASPMSGSVTVDGGAVNQTIAFTAVTPSTYAVTFTESGLPAGAIWSVTLNGQSLSSTTSTITFNESNGTYAYGVSSSGWQPSPGSGTLTVDGISVSEGIAFTQTTYVVTFVETGLPGGTSWSITLNGQTHFSTTATITYSEPNGGYSFTVGSVSGYTTSPISGTVTVNGFALSQSILFATSSTTSGSSSFPWTYLTIGVAIVAVATIVSVAGVARSRRR